MHSLPIGWALKYKTKNEMKKKRLLGVLGALLLMAFPQVAEGQARYKIGVCDWMVLKRQKLGQFELARQLGCDGVELDMGPLGTRTLFENALRDDAVAARFRHVADSLGLEVGAVAMSGFYAQDLTKRDNYLALADDCFDTMDRLGNVRVAFLPLGGCGNTWSTDKALRREVVKRLHDIGERARARGKVVGIDTPLDAKGNLRLLKEVKSAGIAVFYKFQNALEAGADISRDLQTLGARNICAIHASNTDGRWLRNDSLIDLPAIRRTLDKMGWSGWLFVERSRDVKMVRNVKMNYGANVDYLREVFSTPIVPDVALKAEGRPEDYVNTILSRAQKATDQLGITYTRQGRNVLNIVANRYFALNDIYAERDSLKKTDRQKAEAIADQKLYRSHFGFISDLSMYLSEQQIEQVKDVMTYDVVNVTYKAQCDMIPTLTEEEKAQILAWLKEARELAIDAESSKKKHDMFGKYKGRINNYLSARGYDLTKEREGWYERMKKEE